MRIHTYSWLVALALLGSLLGLVAVVVGFTTAAMLLVYQDELSALRRKLPAALPTAQKG